MASMESLSTSLITWIVPAFLAWGLCSSRWLDRHAEAAGRVAGVLAWSGLAAALAGVCLWLMRGGDALVVTLTDAGMIGVRLDALSATLLLLVAFLAAVILRFSRNYLAGDARQGYFFKWMCLTLGSVLALALAPGLVQFGLAWILTSMSLHKLLVYFPDRLGTLLSARKKFLISRIGDLCLIAAFYGIYSVWGVQDFGRLFDAIAGSPVPENIAWIAWLIVAGAVLKSAQFPFHTWLPDTMGAPTPVSALMHAGIINAGGYLVVRLSPVLVQSADALHFLAVAGALTAVFGSLVMLTQTSIKRALAYSTIAQMGFMLLQCGLGAFHLAILHLVAHSLYKAHAFLSSGSSVATAKALASDAAPRAVPHVALAGSALAAAGLVAGLFFAFELEPSEKPGMLVLATVLSIALTHMVWIGLRTSGVRRMIPSSLLAALALGGLYFGLSFVAETVLAPALPGIAPAAPLLEWVLAAVLYAALVGTLLLQDPARSRAGSSGWHEALYVHALNGFYLNTLANRCARFLGLVPSPR